MLSRSRSRSATSAADAGVQATSSSGGSDLICGTVAPAPSWSPLAEHLIGCCAMVHRTGASMTVRRRSCHAAGTRLSGCRSGGRGLRSTPMCRSRRGCTTSCSSENNFGADRAVGAALIENVPALPLMVRAQRAFLARAVRYLVAEADIRQFWTSAPGSRRPTTFTRSPRRSPRGPGVGRRQRPDRPCACASTVTGSPGGKTAFIQADLQDRVHLADPTLSETLDLTEPVALMLVESCMHLHDADDPYGIVSTLMEALPSGGYLTLTIRRPTSTRQRWPALLLRPSSRASRTCRATAQGRSGSPPGWTSWTRAWCRSWVGGRTSHRTTSTASTAGPAWPANPDGHGREIG